MRHFYSLRHSFALHLAFILPLAVFLSAGPLFAQNNGGPIYDDTIGDWVRPTKTVRELGHPYSAPQYWAAFIMLD